ncbi:hypothetical protein P4V86_03190 [Brevibacillus laterosporus]|uniref:Acb2/Tad1 domain-containing protein n=1 Tax=Brevibacillus laterosporus TaxID=1465 RepID=UPI00037AC759|nr:hypothetical protein [Brevibacillus laterosporus]ATO48528.1 hypothetical protein BrL25_05025 [Brevibacillus laterosporus DSM 25]MED2002362.1 hypothetical protein [Brevibacillus laterosporus]
MNPVIENNFMYHAPNEEQRKAFEELREQYKQMAYTIGRLCPNSRERSTAMTNLETSMFWANASIARNGAVS